MRPGSVARHVHHATSPAAQTIKTADLAKIERSEERATPHCTVYARCQHSFEVESRIPRSSEGPRCPRRETSRLRRGLPSKPEPSPSCATHCAVTYPKTELGQSTRFSHRKNHCSRPLLCSSLVFSNVCRQSSSELGPRDNLNLGLFGGTLQDTASTTPPINGNAKKCGSVCPRHLCPIPASHFGAIMPTTLGKTTPPGRTSPDQAKEQTDAARRRARQSIREYELIWLLQQRLRAVSWPHWRLRCMQPLHGHGMGVVRP